MKKILIVDEYEPMREYLSGKLTDCGFAVITARNGLDGLIKLRKSDPDLVIMDYFLSRLSITEILEEKKADPNISAVPVIILSSRLDKKNINILKAYNIRGILNKPLKIDLLFKAISGILHVRLDLDTTPCILEAHFNSEILFIEVARGLNQDKIDLLRFKIIELTELYKIEQPGILLIISDISEGTVSPQKFYSLLEVILSQTRIPPARFKVLSTEKLIARMLSAQKKYADIEMTPDLEQALNSLLGIKLTDFLEEGKDIIKKDFITRMEASRQNEENINLKFSRESTVLDYSSLSREMTLAVVDDDENIRDLISTAFTGSDWRIRGYTNGKQFIADLAVTDFNLLYLDLLMPEMNGFKVLEHMKQKGTKIPVIIFSALSDIETIKKTIGFGIKSYMRKPLQLDLIIKKTKELLKKNF